MSGLDLDAIEATSASVSKYHAEQARYGGVSWEFHARAQTFADEALDEIRRLRSDLAAARAEADGLRGLVGEACDGVDRLACDLDFGPGDDGSVADGFIEFTSSIRARAGKAGGR